MCQSLGVRRKRPTGLKNTRAQIEHIQNIRTQAAEGSETTISSTGFAKFLTNMDKWDLLTMKRPAMGPCCSIIDRQEEYHRIQPK